MNMNEEELRRERRAKMAQLQRQLDLSDGFTERTSAPSVRKVDQFVQEFGAADRQAQNAPVEGPLIKERTLFYGGGTRVSYSNITSLKQVLWKVIAYFI